jgi:hypothetical protein
MIVSVDCANRLAGGLEALVAFDSPDSWSPKPDIQLLFRQSRATT